MKTVTVTLEVAALALALSSIVWVLIIQAIGLLRSMPRTEFLPLQMRLVRVWSRALVGITAVVALAAIVRAGEHGWPALAAFVAAAVCARWAIPRALRSGGEAAKSSEGESMSSAGFLADGGGEATHTWHRVVLAFMLVVIVGLGWEARSIARDLGGASTQHDQHHHALAPAPAVSAATARVRVDRATAENIARLERESASVLAAGGSGDVSAVRTGWNRIFSECTTRGTAHERLHEYLIPLAALVERAESSQGAQRRDAMRALVAGLGRFDATFEAAL